MSVIHELATPRPVEVTSATLPRGVTTTDRRGSCVAWWLDEESHYWLVCFDETGEFVWVPMHEIKAQSNWSGGRRYARANRATTET
jgi:hypothetical protein